MDVDELMAEMGWVRRLARGLLRDSAAADDIAQDAWLVASERAPEDDRPLRPWLHRVVVNLVRMRRRSETRRDSREQASGEDRAMPSSEELLERVETQRVLAAEVVALREPYRSTILLHYVEGLSSAEIARQLGIPSATVRQRLKHALDELRDRLRAREDGPNQGWLAALVPLAKVRHEPALAVGTLVMKKVIAVIAVIAVLVLALLLGGVGWRVLRSRDRAKTETGTSAGTAGVAFARPLTTTAAGKKLVVPSWLVQSGAPARRVAGRVELSGKPVPGAKVRIGVLLGSPRRELPAMTPGPPFVEVEATTTSARGEFDFGVLPAASFVISAEADGKAPVSIGVALADPRVVSDHLLLVLGDCRIRVVGTVRDSASPVAHARLKIAGLAQVESDASGKFSICMPMERYPNISVEATGYGSINVQVPPMYGEFRRDFVLVPEATIIGTVVDDEGEAISGAVVSARPALSDAQDEATTRETFTDESGRFMINGLAPTKFRMSALTGSGATEHQPIVVAVGGAVTPEVRLVVVHRSRLRGRVLAAGLPVVGAHVGVDRTTPSSHSGAYAISQTDGSFTLDGVRRGTVSFDIERYDVVSPRQLVVDRDDVGDVVIEVVVKSSLHGRITRHGVAVSGATLEGQPGDVFVTAAADGTYVLADLTPGTLKLTARSEKAFTDRTVEVGPGDQFVDFELDGGGEIDGVVVDEGGAPVPAVSVHFASTDQSDVCDSLTDERGAYECASLAGHLDYVASVSPAGRRSNPFQPVGGKPFTLVHVDGGDTVVADIRLAIQHDRLSIRGKVVDDTGAGVADARISLAESLDWGDPDRTRSQDNGEYVLDGLVAGKYSVRARLSDGSVGDVRLVPAGATDVVIKLVRPGAIVGTLDGFSTPPMVLASIDLRPEADVHEAVVEGNHFSITGLKPGSYTVQALVDNVQLDGSAVEVKTGATSTVSLHARPRVAIEGRVRELASGAPVVGLSCRASLEMDGREGVSIGSSNLSPLTDATGTFALTAPVGRVRVTCDSSGALSQAAADVQVDGNGTVHADLYSVREVLPSSNPGFGLEPSVIPPTVFAIAGWNHSGMTAGDQVISIDDTPTASLGPFAAVYLAENHRLGTPLVVRLLRHGTPLTVQYDVR